MKIQVLGCSGGIGPDLRTTSILIDDDVLIDCGSGVGDLSMEELSSIKHIFLSHAHLDHIAFLPFLLDSAFDDLVDNPITIHLQSETLTMLQEYIFNWKIWPDFSKLPDKTKPVMQYNVIKPYQHIKLNDRIIEPIPVTHTQPAIGFRVTSPSGGAFAFSGDTKNTDEFWNVLNSYSNLDILFVECAYPDHEDAISQIAGHHRPSTLAKDLRKLQHQPDLYIMHQKTGEEEQIMSELKKLLNGKDPKILKRGQLFEI